MDSFGRAIATTAMWASIAFIINVVILNSHGSTAVVIPTVAIACGTAMIATVKLWELKKSSSGSAKDLS